MKKTLLEILLILIIILSVTGAVLAQQDTSFIPAPTPPPAQHVQLEAGGTVYVLGDCHMIVDVNGADSLQISCVASK